tara:strand:+ start:1290 stop:1700 length:411 start_codon:yes stop_codon:yes gene_type:complete
MNTTTTKRNIVIKTKRQSFMFDNSMQYIAVDSDTGEILGEAHWDRFHSCYELNVDGHDLDVEELCDARFGHRKDAFQKDAPARNHPDFVGMTNPAYTTRHDYKDWQNFKPTVKSLKTLLVELAQNVKATSKYIWKD